MEYRRVETPEEVARIGFAGSPTIMVDGTDPFVTGQEPTGLACRVYATEDWPRGAPTVDQRRAAIS